MCRPSRTLQTGDAPALEQGIPEITVHTTATAATAADSSLCGRRHARSGPSSILVALRPFTAPGGAGEDAVGIAPALVKLLVPVAVPPSRPTARTPVPSY